MGIVCTLLAIYWAIVLVWAISSWFATLPGQGGSLARQVNRLLAPLVEPLLRPLRRFLPTFRMGMVGLDLSPLILFVVIYVIRVSICR